MKNRQSKISRRQTRQAWLSVLPALLLILVMCAYPIVQTVIKSFTDWNGIGAAVSVGFKNYINILSSGQFWSLLRNNLIFLLFIPFQVLIGVIVAVLIYDGIPGRKDLPCDILYPAGHFSRDRRLSVQGAVQL